MLSIDELKKCYPLMKNRQCLFEQALSTNELKKRATYWWKTTLIDNIF